MTSRVRYQVLGQPELAKDLRAIGLSMLSTANNHSNNWGVQAISGRARGRGDRRHNRSRIAGRLRLRSTIARSESRYTRRLGSAKTHSLPGHLFSKVRLNISSEHQTPFRAAYFISLWYVFSEGGNEKRQRLRVELDLVECTDRGRRGRGQAADTTRQGSPGREG